QLPLATATPQAYGLGGQEGGSVINEEVVRRIEEALEEYLEKREENGDQVRETTQEAIEKIKERIYFDELEYYLPYFYEETYLWDYLPKDTIVVFNNPFALTNAFGKEREKNLNIYNENQRRGYLVHKDYMPCYMAEDFLENFVGKFTALGLCELPPPEGIFSRFLVRDRINQKSKQTSFGTVKEPELLNDVHREYWIYDDIEIPTQPVESYVDKFNDLVGYLNHKPKGERVVFATASENRMYQILSDYDINSVIVNNNTPVFNLTTEICVVHAPIIGGADFPSIKLKILTDAEVFGIKRGKKVRKLLNDTKAVKNYLDLKVGDYVVHQDYGICRYEGVERKQVMGTLNDFLILQFENNQLFVSTNGIDLVQKYVGGDGLPPKLSKLGGKEWERVKTRAKKKIWEIAKELVDLYAYRQSVKGYEYDTDTKWQEDLEKSFPYKETKTQLQTIKEVKRDLESDKPMDRLVCGDVGFGKTEVAIRAAFKVVMAGRQVAVLAPTTVLSEQHYMSFKERMAPFPHKIEILNRFKSSKEIKQSIENIKNGTADIVIGTHRVLSKDVEFANLGLLIIDEEQRFGVRHKERLKELRKDVDVLSMSATPIPRTLNMSLSGIREISLITDAPEGRVPIKTRVKPYDEALVQRAIKDEILRGGQVFFVHNRVEDIYRVADMIEKLCPEAKVDVAHGQMHEKDLEECMMDFYKGKVDVLVATTIIENGIDVPNANTIIIDNADKLGLSQLYQLRGRVGRSGRQAFAYLLYRGDVTVEGEERLKALQEFSDLGSGFRIAERDLEIRGAGNLLGSEQSGNIEGIGFEYYCNLLKEAVAKLKGEEVTVRPRPTVDIQLDTYIPEDYIEAEGLRIMFYKKLAQVSSKEVLLNIKSEMKDRFGDLPEPCENMFTLLNLSFRAEENNIKSIIKDGNRYSMVFDKGKVISSGGIKKIKEKYTFLQASYDRLSYYAPDPVEDTIRVFDVMPEINEIIRKNYSK
ncbi:MAG: transcription-repair coupling factor, partial [Abditibacteriota bacterium]|nr:transcription-repair coupling factor [Abditibacteriota bacterium]